MKSIVAFLFALLVGTACVYKSGLLHKSNVSTLVESSSSVDNEPVEQQQQQGELLEKRAVFHALKEEDDDDQANFGFDNEDEEGFLKDSDRQRKKLYFQQSALQRHLNANGEEASVDEGLQKRRQAKKKSKSKSSKKSKSKSKSSYYNYWYSPPVGAVPARPVSRPVALPVSVNYNVPIRAKSPRINQPVGVTFNANQPRIYSKGKGSKSSSSWKNRYYNSRFVSQAPAFFSAGNVPGFVYVEATANDCQAISNGGLVEGQRSMSSNTFTFGFNLALDYGTTNIETVVATAQAALQALVAQRIANCNGFRRILRTLKGLNGEREQKHPKRHHRKKHRRTLQQRQLQTGNSGLDDNIFGNANFNVENCLPTTPCDVEGACFDCSATVDVAMKGPAEVSAVEEELTHILQDADLIGESELGETAHAFSATAVTHTSTTLPQIGGDPHIVTWKGEHYEYHGQCDMVMVNDANFADGLGLDIHIRTKLVRFWSYIKNVSIRIGSDILEIVGNPDINSREPMYWINYESNGDLEDISGFPIKYTATSGSKSIYEIDLSSKFPNERDGAKIIVKIYKEFLRVKMVGGANVWGNTVGLLGNYHTGETLGRDGVSVFDDYYKFGPHWQVNPSLNDPKLFQSLEHPQFPAKCVLPDNPLGDRRRRRLAEDSSISEEAAEKACATLKDPDQVKDCVYDVLATQDVDMVGAF